tara:strand:+ start:3120 stop:3725 length:606 start_codon:yes stop_codon:yes gene_type:complete
MHGLVNKSIQSFITDSFGAPAWDAVMRRSGFSGSIGPDGFEAMQIYEDQVTFAVIDAAVDLLRRPRESLLEDLGTFLISNEKLEPLRRLLRFGGVSFTDFLYSLDDLQGRSALAVPELALPELTVEETGSNTFVLNCRHGAQGFGHVLVGILRALADDYGALAVLEYSSDQQNALHEQIYIEVHDPAFHAGRQFDLAVEVQ